MRINKRLLSMLMVITMLLGSITVFGQDAYEDVKWVAEPKIVDSESKKIDVFGTLEVPESYNGNTKIKLEINGFVVNLDKDGSFIKSIFKVPEIEVKVFTGKEEIVELSRVIKYVMDKTNVNEVIRLIDELPDIAELSLDDKEQVAAARAYYSTLLPEERELVTNYDKLVAAENRLEELFELLLQEMIQEAEEAIAVLPSLEDIRIEHKEAVLDAIAMVEAIKAMDSNAVVNGEELLAPMLEKIEYLEAEESYNIRYTTSSPQMYDLFGTSAVPFEGYFYNAKYIDRVLIEDTGRKVETVEADIEYIEDWVFRDSSGKVLYTGPAYKYNADVVCEDGFYTMKIIGISQSGVQNNTAARFSVDTTAPVLEININGVNENNVTEAESVEVEVTMRDNFANLTLYLWDSYEFGKSFYTSDSRFRQPAEYTYTTTLDLEIGENEFPFTLIDEAGNETVRTIKITREDPQPTLYAYYYQEVVSPWVTNTYLLVNVENIEGATRYRARYINAKGSKVSTNTAGLGEPVQIGSGAIDPTDIEVVIMKDGERDNILHVFENVNPIKIEKP